MKTNKGKLSPVLAALLVFLLDVPIGSAYISDAQDAPLEEFVGENPSSIPPLVCSGHACNKDWSLEHTPVDSTPPTMEFGWWEDFWSDSDSNGFDDRLQMILAGERESVSLTSIIGSDGRPTVAIINIFATIFEVQLGGPGADHRGSERKTKRWDRKTSPKDVLSGLICRRKSDLFDEIALWLY